MERSFRTSCITTSEIRTPRTDFYVTRQKANDALGLQSHDGDYDVNCTVDTATDDALNLPISLNWYRFTIPVHVLALQIWPLIIDDDATANQLNQQRQQKYEKLHLVYLHQYQNINQIHTVF